MPNKVIVVPEDANCETYAIQDEHRNHLADAETVAEAVEKAIPFAQAAGLDRVIVMLHS